MTNTTNDELKTFYSTFLVKEIKDKVQILREYGMNEAEIISKLFQSPSLPQLFISRNYRIFLGEEHKEVHLEPLVKAVFLLFLKHPEGINFKDLPDYREELTKYYTATAKGADRDKMYERLKIITLPRELVISTARWH